MSNRTGSELRVTFLTIDKPDVTAPSYTISGEVEYEGVEGRGYLELMSYLPPPSPVSHPGPMGGWLTGGRKAFAVLIPLHKDDPKPIKLELNVVLPSGGTVYIGRVKLMQNQANNAYGRVVLGKWRSNQELGRIGGTFGGIIGGLGGLMGVLGGLIGTLSTKGKARGLVMGMIWFMIGSGVVCFVVGLAAVVTHQWWVFYAPLFLLGLLLITIGRGILPVVRQRYDELELRRISAQDAGG